MLVLLNDDLLRAESYATDLIAFLQKSTHGRCYLAVENRSSEAHRDWLSALSPGQRQAWEAALDLAIRDSALYRIRTIRVEPVETSQWAAQPARLTPADASRLIDRTKRIWVENERNDRRFWLSAVGKQTRDYIEALERRGVIEFRGPGGITELKEVLQERIAYEEDRHYANWMLFDSDAPIPGQLSQQAQDLEDACFVFDIPSAPLPRRAIENYLPKDALYAFANSQGNKKSREAYFRRLDAFYRMSQDQRSHFPLKKGFRAIKDPKEGLLFSSVSAEDQEVLKFGIASNIAGQYEKLGPERIHKHMTKEGSNLSLLPVIQRVLDSYRAPYAG